MESEPEAESESEPAPASQPESEPDCLEYPQTPPRFLLLLKRRYAKALKKAGRVFARISSQLLPRINRGSVSRLSLRDNGRSRPAGSRASLPRRRSATRCG